MPAPKKQPPPLDRLEALAKADLREIIALMLWSNRIANPELTVYLTEKDIDGLKACCDYVQAKPKVRIHRPQGVPPHPGIPASGNRREIPPHPGVAPKPYVVVQLVDEAGDAIRPMETTEEGYAKAREEEARRRQREQVPDLIAQAEADLRNGVMNEGTMRALCAAARMLQ